jgi:transcriptional regulator with XRE-family HTH domain
MICGKIITTRFKGVTKMFGKFIKEKRLSLDLTLREFCKKNNEDPSNWSKLEREVKKPPINKEILKEYAKYLNIKEGSEEYQNFVDFANIDQGKIPEDIFKNNKILKLLPAFFRTARDTKPTEEELMGIIKSIQEAYEPGN